MKREQTERGERTEANGVRVRLDLRTELGSFVIFRICRVVSEIFQKKKKKTVKPLTLEGAEQNPKAPTSFSHLIAVPPFHISKDETFGRG